MQTAQSQIYTIFHPTSPLYTLAQKFPQNMCWLTTFLYACECLGFENDKGLHRKLSSLLYKSFNLLFINKENGAMYFPKKYELSDGKIKSDLNEVFAQSGLRIKVLQVFSDIKFGEIQQMEQYLSEGKQLMAIVKNKHLDSSLENLDIPNHTVLFRKLTNHQDGRITIEFLDPSDGYQHSLEIGVNVLMQWIQYVWVLERRYTIFEKLFGPRVL